MKEREYVRLERRPGGVALLTLSNPPLNLNTSATLDQLLSACEALAGDLNVRAVVVTGSGDRAFCAGSDVKEFAGVRDDVVGRKLARENEAFTAIETLPMPVVAALNGTTLGGGAEIAIACDIRFMDEGARIGFPEVKLGVFPGSGGVFRLPRLIGPAHACQMLYTGDLYTAREALQMGLVNTVTRPGETLGEALAFADRLAKGPALALSLIRSGVRDSLGQTTAEATRRTLEDSHAVFRGPDIEEGLEAFFAKRPPDFTAPRS